MTKRVKLKDIAEALGISITTVSRALNNKSDINQATRRKILEMASEMDYKPNNLAISLRKNKSAQVIGVVLPIINHYFFSTVLKGIMTRAHLHNYMVLVGESLHVLQKEKQILEEFVDYGVSGILIAPCLGSNFEQNLLPIIHRRIPTVVMDRMYENYNGNFVLTNDYKGAFDAVEHLIKNGYTKIAHLSSLDAHSVGAERRKGYLDALKKNEITPNPDYLKQLDLKEEVKSIRAAYFATESLFKLDNPPDAIFTVTDEIALGVYQYAQENNINIPNDLGIVGFSNAMISKYISPQLTTVEQNGILMGETAYDFFHQALHSNGHLFQKTFDSNLIVRESSIPK